MTCATATPILGLPVASQNGMLAEAGQQTTVRSWLVASPSRHIRSIRAILRRWSYRAPTPAERGSRSVEAYITS